MLAHHDQSAFHAHCKCYCVFPVDPYEEASGGETVLHWACQSNIMDGKLLQLLFVR